MAQWIGKRKSYILGLEWLIASLMNMHGQRAAAAAAALLPSCFGGFSDATAASVMRPIERGGTKRKRRDGWLVGQTGDTIRFVILIMHNSLGWVGVTIKLIF